MTLATFVHLLGSWADGSGPVYQRLADAIRASIERGDIPPETRLPSERRLAERLAVSRTTVVSAFQQLRSGQWIESRQGSGTSVRAAPRGHLAMRLKEDPAGSFRRHPVYRSLVEGAGGTIEFLGAHLPAPEVLKREALRIDQAALGEILRGPGYLPMGLPALRQADRPPPHALRARDHRGSGPGDARRAAGHRSRGHAVRGTRRRGGHRESDVPRLDRHLQRALGAARRRAGRRRRGLDRAPQGDGGPLRSAPDLRDADVPESHRRGAPGGGTAGAGAALPRAADPRGGGQHARGPLPRARRRRRRSPPSIRRPRSSRSGRSPSCSGAGCGSAGSARRRRSSRGSRG